MRKVEFGKREVISVPYNGILPDGRFQLSEFLIQQGYPAPPFEFLTQWKIDGRGEYVGTLTKRLSKWYYKNHSIKLCDSTMERIGNIALQHTIPDTYYLEFRNQLWRAGDFGDPSSCFFPGKQFAHAPDNIFDNGGYGCCLFDDCGQGHSRCWVAPPNYDSDCLVIFNSYGSVGLAEFARLLAFYHHAHYKAGYVDSYDDSCLYVNSDTCFVIGAVDDLYDMPTVIDRPQTIKVTLDWDWNSQPGHVCYNCGSRIGENEGAYIDGEWYCGDCYFYCESCQEYCTGESFRTIDGDYVCEYCRDNNYTYCDKCRELVPNRDIADVSDTGESVCSACLSDHYHRCENCEEWFAELGEDGENCPDCQPEPDPDPELARDEFLRWLVSIGPEPIAIEGGGV